jgi:hypothetical protein
MKLLPQFFGKNFVYRYFPIFLKAGPMRENLSEMVHRKM